MMNPREKMLAALERRPITGRVPHFELVFFLTMEAFGRVSPTQRAYHQWQQMTASEQELHIRDIADLYVQSARRYEHAGILFQPVEGWDEAATRRCLERIAEQSGGELALLLHGDCTFGMPPGEAMMEFSLRMAEDAAGLKCEAEKRLRDSVAAAERIRKWGVVDGFALCSDYCFNTNPFFSPAQFEEFVLPYLCRVIEAYRGMDFYTIKHTDGNIMPILEQLASCRPHALHSLDPQGGVDIAEVKRQVGDRLCLIGNVSCAALQTGTLAEVEESARYALEMGMPGYGYIFGTSNCIYTGMELARYEYMLEVWRRYGNY